MQKHFKDTEKIQEVLHEAQTGLWVIEMDPEKTPRMYADDAMLELLGIDGEVSPEDCYSQWYDNIEESYYGLVQEGVERMISDDQAEVQYPWNHPWWGRIYVRCGGVRDRNYKSGICVRGYHQNITNTVMLKQEYDAVIQSLSDNYIAIFLCSLDDRSFKVIKIPEERMSLTKNFTDCEEMLKSYVLNEVDVPYREIVMESVGIPEVKRQIEKDRKSIEVSYRNQTGGYRKIKVVPAATYSSESPLVIAAFDEQTGEMEKRLDEAAAKTAVSQIYKLVISVNLDQAQYNCIHYSGSVLKMERHGTFEQFASQMLERMPSEDKILFWEIFNADNYTDNGYREGILRLYGEGKELMYYSFCSTCITHGIEKRILMTVRDLDAGYEIRKRENVLSKLSQCYYSIYLFDFENDLEEAIWQEEEIKKRREYPKGSLEKYYGKFVSSIVYKEDQEKMRKAGSPDFLRQTLTPGNPVYDIDYRREYPDGYQWIRARFSIAEIKDAEITKVVFANMNIHDQKVQELEEEKQKKNALYAAYEEAKSANEAKSNFLAQMSHDIRTPMNAIMGMAAIASSQVEDVEKVKECLREINVSSRHLLELINEVLDMSKIEQGKMELMKEPFSLKKVLESVVSILGSEAAGKQHQITVKQTEFQHDHLVGDPAKIKQVLLNLGTNAVKYTPVGGRIWIEAQELSGSMPGHGCFVFTVEDNGIGMDKEFLDCIFVPFSRADDTRIRHIQGTGLGMSIARNIVNAMGGSIQVESRKGQGSRFTVTLNLEIAGDELEKVVETDTEVTGIDVWAFPENTRILLAEDNALNMEIAKTMLMDEGLLVDCAENGKQAADMFNSSALGTYQAVLMDLQMPVLDGFGAARAIREGGHPQASDIPVIALTANAFAEDIARSLAAGMNDHISKPIDYEHLFKVIGKSITRKDQEGEYK